MQLTSNSKDNIIILRSAIRSVVPSEILQDLCLTQAVHESNLLRSPSQLAMKYNNLFGIKGKGLTGKSVMLPTWEEVNGKTVYIKAPFAQNDSLEDSVKQWYKLMNKPRYKIVLDSKSLDDAFVNIVKAGYATDSRYSTKLKSVYDSIKDIK